MKRDRLISRLLAIPGLLVAGYAVYSMFGVANWAVFGVCLLVSAIVSLFPIQTLGGNAYLIGNAGLYSAYLFLGPGAAAAAMTAGYVAFAVYQAIRSRARLQLIRAFNAIGMGGVSLLFVRSVMVKLHPADPLLRVLLLIILYETSKYLLRYLYLRLIRFPFNLRENVLNELKAAFVPLILTVYALEHLQLRTLTYTFFSQFVYFLILLTGTQLLAHAYSRVMNRERESGQRFQSLFEHNLDVVVTLDRSGRILSVNPMFSETLSLSEDEAIGKDLFELLEGQVPKELLLQSLERLKPCETYMALEVHGQRIELQMTFIPSIVHNRLQGIYAIGKDVTAIKMAERTIYQIAYYDSITGLPNRSKFLLELNRSIQGAKTHPAAFALCFLDIDQFKAINDSWGHHTGDQLLIQLADRLRETFQHPNAVARLSGDEFAILLPGLQSQQEVERQADRVMQVFSHYFAVGEDEFYITSSVGIAMFPAHGQEVTELLKNADTAMYRSKKDGGNKYTLYGGVSEEEKLNTRLQSALFKALERGEFRLNFQPQYDLTARAIYGVEALIRWHSPEFGEVPPSRFIPLAEKNRMIVGIGEWVLREACRHNKRWQDRGHSPITISVNLSYVQLQDPDFTGKVRRILDETGLDPKWLEFEITEGVLMVHTARSMEILSSLKAIGVRISVDDFGVGYSSLSYLNAFPVDTVKIDKSFVQNVGLSRKDELIINAIINLSKSLSLRVVAEGVESFQQLHYLEMQECHAIQGYMLGKPVEAKELEANLWGRPRLLDDFEAAAAWESEA